MTKSTKSINPTDALQMLKGSKSANMMKNNNIDVVDKVNANSTTTNENGVFPPSPKANTDNVKRYTVPFVPEETLNTPERDVLFFELFEAENQQSTIEAISTFSDGWKNEPPLPWSNSNSVNIAATSTNDQSLRDQEHHLHSLELSPTGVSSIFLPAKTNVATGSAMAYPTVSVNSVHHCCPFSHYHYSSQHFQPHFYYGTNEGCFIAYNVDGNFHNNSPYTVSSYSSSSGSSSSYDCPSPHSNSTATFSSATATSPTLSYFGHNQQQQHEGFGNAYYNHSRHQNHHYHCIRHDGVKNLNITNNAFVQMCADSPPAIDGTTIFTDNNPPGAPSSSTCSCSNSKNSSSFQEDGKDTMALPNKRNSMETCWPSYYKTPSINCGPSLPSSSINGQDRNSRSSSHKRAKQKSDDPLMSMMPGQEITSLQKSRRCKFFYDPKTSYQLNTLFFETFGNGRKPTKLERRRIQKKTGINSRQLTYWLCNHKRRFSAELRAFSRLTRAGKVDGYSSFVDFCKYNSLPELPEDDAYSDVVERANALMNSEDYQGTMSEGKQEQGKQHGENGSCSKKLKGKNIMGRRTLISTSSQKQNRKGDFRKASYQEENGNVNDDCEVK